MSQVFSKPITTTQRHHIGHEQQAFEGRSATNPLAIPFPCDLCLDAASKPIPPYEPNVSSLTGQAPHPTDLVKPDIQGEFFCVTAGRQVGIVSNQATANQYMDVEGSSGQRFPNWEEACAYYTAHYHRACMHVIPPIFPPRTATPPPPPIIPTNNPPKKKSKTVKSATPSTRRRRRPRVSSSSSGANYRSLYDDDDPITPVAARLPPATSANVGNPAPHSPTPVQVALSPGAAGNPIEVASNFPTPITNQETRKRRQKAQGLGLGGSAPISPTPQSAALPTLLSKVANSRKKPGPSIPNGPDRFVYVCDCSDGEYSAPRVPSLKRKASNNASGSSTRTHEVIEIRTDSDSDGDIQLPRTRFCKCAALKSFLSASKPDVNHDHAHVDMDTPPEIPRPSPPAQF